MASSTGAAGRGESKSPKQSSTTATTSATETSPQDTPSDVKNDGAPILRLEPSSSSNAAETTAKPLAPPPRPQPQQQQQPTASNSPSYFSNPVGGSLSLEPNPFEQSFGGGAAPETPGGTKLPSVAALTSPSSLLPGTGATPFGWGGGGLRNGPLSPAMLSGPTDYFSDTHHLRGSFPTPNESSLRTGLTPGGSGSMFPVPSPNTQAFLQIAGGGAATPSTLEFQRTALAAAAKREQVQAQPPPPPPPLAPTSQPQEASNGVVPLKHPEPVKPAGSYDPHDNDAANGLFMLAQGRNSTQPPVPQYPPVPPAQVHNHPIQAPAPAVQPINTSPHMNGGSSVGGREGRSVSVAMSAQSDESELAQQNTRTTRAKGKRGSTSAAAGSRRKGDDMQTKGPANKKAKINGNGNPHTGPPSNGSYDEMDHSDDDDDDQHNHKEGGSRSKMTDEEKRKNFLERNRVAALKCRQRKKQWLQNLQSKVELYSNENDALSQQITQLREEVVNLKTLLLAHKDCPVTQQQGLHTAFSMQQQPMEPYNASIPPYGMMPGPMAGQPVANGGSRRFS
ncbi:transcription factor atf1 [Cladorrhinum samala]|uniref:Transcription factor atf1 n=1 Tax=Cladorrhinum samala TaxID=585594 RepID=A0AAV9HT51_9PEZI|nr:transcription factor atf1 [Cladorrhinum samala]